MLTSCTWNQFSELEKVFVKLLLAQYLFFSEAFPVGSALSSTLSARLPNLHLCNKTSCSFTAFSHLTLLQPTMSEEANTDLKEYQSLGRQGRHF